MNGTPDAAGTARPETEAPLPYDPAEMGPRRRSALAVLSLVLSVLPVGSAVAPILGVAALLRMRRDPRLDGAPLAWAGIIVGIVATTLMAGGAWMQWAATQHVVQMPHTAIEAAGRGDLDGFRAQFTKPGSEATATEIRAFAAALAGRLGRLREVSVSRTPLPNAAQPTSDRQARLPFRATFERGEVPVEVLYESVDGRAIGMGSLLIRRLAVVPADGPRIVFPDDEPAAPKQEGADAGR